MFSFFFINKSLIKRVFISQSAFSNTEYKKKEKKELKKKKKKILLLK